MVIATHTVGTNIATHTVGTNIATHTVGTNIATHTVGTNIANPRKEFIGFRKTSYLRNCTILSKLLLGNGELASLAYGSLKELHKIEELFQGAALIQGTHLSDLGAPTPIFLVPGQY
jgi:hypothetical protein